MDMFHIEEIEGELMLIGIIAILGCFIYYKLDKMMELQVKTNELLKKLTEKDNKE